MWVTCVWLAICVVVAVGESPAHAFVFGIYGLIPYSFVVFVVVYITSRGDGRPNIRERECPACGVFVTRGRTVCQQCGYDFAAAAAHPN
jgi:ribosomal protein S27AE